MTDVDAMLLSSGNELERALKKIGREDVIVKCMYNIEEVTDAVEKAAAKTELDQPGEAAVRGTAHLAAAIPYST